MINAKELLDFIKNTIETTATASVKAILQATHKVIIGNESLNVNIKNLPNPLPVKGDVTVKNLKDHTEDWIELQRVVEGIPALLKNLATPTARVSNLKDIKFPNKLEVSNPQRKVEVTNLDALYKALQSIKTAISELPKEFPETKIPPFPKLPEYPKFPEMKFPKMPEFPKEISVKDLQKLIKLAEKLTAGDPKEPIAVRLSDGKKFYEAITEFLTTGGGGQIPFTYYAGGRAEALITSKREQAVSMTERYTNNDVDIPNATTTYIGQEDVDSNWLVTRIVQSGNVNSFRYATIRNNATKTTYTGAWNARATLSYGKVSEAL